jgi:hypothetical protein
MTAKKTQKNPPKKGAGDLGVKYYTVSVQHGRKTLNLGVVASSPTQAKQMVMKAEGCPACAITGIRPAQGMPRIK